MLSSEAAERNRERSRERAQKMRAEQRCLMCGRRDEKTLAGRAYCKDCAEYHSIKQMDYQDKLRTQGRCKHCGKPVEPERVGKAYCETCQRRHNERYGERTKQSGKERRKKRMECGLCVLCGKPNDRPGMTYCSDCAERLKICRLKKAVGELK